MRPVSPANFAVLFTLLLPGFAGADEVTIGPAADACLFEPSDDFNFGANDTVPAGTLGPMVGGGSARGILRFDVAAAVPAGSTIAAATLTLRVTMEPGSAEDSTFALYAVFQDWGEGGGSSGGAGGQMAQPGEVTWNSRFHGSATWDEPGGEIGGDFAEDPSAQRAVTGVGAFDFVFNATGVADLQDMLDFPASNHGWVLISEDEATQFTAKRFTTREHAQPPQLTITFTPPAPVAEPVVLAFALDFGAATGSVDFVRAAGLEHRLQFNATLAAGNWATVAQLPPLPNDSVGNFTFAIPVDHHGFWRIEAAHPGPP